MADCACNCVERIKNVERITREECARLCAEEAERWRKAGDAHAKSVKQREYWRSVAEGAELCALLLG